MMSVIHKYDFRTVSLSFMIEWMIMSMNTHFVVQLLLYVAPMVKTDHEILHSSIQIVTNISGNWIFSLIYIYISLVYSPFSDRVGIILHNIPSP